MNDDLLNGYTQDDEQDINDGPGYDPMADFEEYMNSSGNSHDMDNNEGETKNEDLLDGVKGFEDGELLAEVLKAKGFNPNAIRIEDEETGEEITVPFNQLSREEQKSILGYEEEREGYSEDEINTINYLRQNNATLQDLVEYVRAETIREMEAKNSDTGTSVSQLSDDELFVADFINKNGDNFTDDELQSQLDYAKRDQSVFERRIQRIREDYEAYEKQELENKKTQEQGAKQKQLEAEFNTVRSFADGINELHNTIELDNKDKNAILDYMYKKNACGKSAFDKDMEDPRNRFMAAWYFRLGDEAFKSLHRYYRGELAKQQRQRR